MISAEYEYPTHSHASMGPGCAVADVREDGVTIYTSTQKPHFAADGIANLLGVPRDKVHAIWMFGTGSYGRNDQGDATADAAVLSKALGKPVRVQWSREEGLAWDPKGTAAVNFCKAGIDADGNVLAYELISKGFSRARTSPQVKAAQPRRLPVNYLAFRWRRATPSISRLPPTRFRIIALVGKQ